MVGITLLAAAAMAVGGYLVAGRMISKAQGVEQAAQGGCESGLALQDHTIILVDLTDRLRSDQISLIGQIIEFEQQRLSVAGRLTLYVLTEQPYAPRELESLCKPKPPQETNELIEARFDVMRRWRNQFTSKIDTALKDVLDTDTANASPIMEAFSVLGGRYDFSGQVETRRLVIISDMLQYSDRYSLYVDEVPKHEEFLTQSGLELQHRLSGVDVQLHLIPRPLQPYQQSDDFMQFWRDYFSEAEAQRFTCGPDGIAC